MARLHAVHHGRVAKTSSALDRSRVLRKKKPYKILLEAVTQEKKKLQSVMTYRADAPPGYMFVPLGNRDITEYCKDQCRERNVTAHIVSAKPKPKAGAPPAPAKDSEHEERIDTQRIGHHFPLAIVDEACENLGYDSYDHREGKFLKSRRDIEQSQLARSLRDHGQRMALHGRPATDTQTRDQIRSGILEVFPKIPEADLTSIVTHAFEQGTNRVGNAKDLTLARRVQLAVGAYIRHTYTDYDNILKTGGSWLEARQKVQPVSFAKLKEWRDESDGDEVEETFREIIVLDDDDDDESDTSDDTLSDGGPRQPSLEIISSQATARELQPEYHSGVTRGVAPGWRLLPERSSSLRSIHRPHRILANSSRHSGSVYRADTRLPYSAPIQAARPYEQHPYHAGYRLPVESRSRTAAEPISRAPQPSPHSYTENGRVYNLEPIPEPRARPQVVEYTPLPSASHHHYRDGHVQNPSRVNFDNYHSNRSAPLPVSRRPPGEDDVLPSIEQRDHEPIAERRENPQHNRRYDDSSVSTGYYSAPQPGAPSPMRPAFPAPVNGVRDDYHYQRPMPPPREEAQPRPSQTSMFQRMHTRNATDMQDRSRVQSGNHMIDLTSSFSRPSAGAREEYAAPAGSYTETRSNSRLHVTQPLRHYVDHGPEYGAAERHALRRYEPVVGPRDSYMY